jgi:hypothetical protein
MEDQTKMFYFNLLQKKNITNINETNEESNLFKFKILINK